MQTESLSASRRVAEAPSFRTRSAVTNGRRLHVTPVGDTAWSRRFRDVLEAIVSDLGGADRLSEGQRQLARRCATIALECERLEARAVAGEQIDLECYGQLTDRLGRTFGRLGLKRVANDTTPSLAEYLAARTTENATGSLEDEEGSEAPDEETPAGESASASLDVSP